MAGQAASNRLKDNARRTGKLVTYTSDAMNVLTEFARERKAFVTSQYLAFRRLFERRRGSSDHDASITEAALLDFDMLWQDLESQLKVIPGKEALTALNQTLQAHYEINITHTSIIDTMKIDEIGDDMKLLLLELDTFAKARH